MPERIDQLTSRKPTYRKPTYRSNEPNPISVKTTGSMQLTQAFNTNKKSLQEYCERIIHLPKSLDLLNKKVDELRVYDLRGFYHNPLLDILLSYTLEILNETAKTVPEHPFIQIKQPDGSVVIGKKISPILNSITKASDLTITILNAYKKTKTGSNFSWSERGNAIKSVITAFETLSQSPLYDSETKDLIETQLKKIKNVFIAPPFAIILTTL